LIKVCGPEFSMVSNGFFYNLHSGIINGPSTIPPSTGRRQRDLIASNVQNSDDAGELFFIHLLYIGLNNCENCEHADETLL